MNEVNIRYIVDDVAAAIDFYTSALNFELVINPAPGFAMLKRGSLRLLLNTAGAGGAGQAMSDGTQPQAGGWNRFQIVVDDLEATVSNLKKSGATFRNELVVGNGGKQIILEDPAGNPIELFESHR